jgi:hypothetical protein
MLSQMEFWAAIRDLAELIFSSWPCFSVESTCLSVKLGSLFSVVKGSQV